MEVQRCRSTVILEGKITPNCNITIRVPGPFRKNPSLISIIPYVSVRFPLVRDVRPRPRSRRQLHFSGSRFRNVDKEF